MYFVFIMQEGTGLGLYILIATILFGVFAVMTGVFGDDVGQSVKIS